MGINRLQTGVMGVVVAFGLAGCSAPLTSEAPRFHRLHSAEASPDASRLILPSDVALADPTSGGGMEFARRDRSLAVGTLDGNLAVPAFYEGEVPPNLWEARRLYLGWDPRQVLYFQPGYDRRHDSHRYWY